MRGFRANLEIIRPSVTRTDLLARLRERILAFAASRLGRESAEDLTQEVLIVLHEKYAHLDRIEDLLPLSLQIVRFKIMAARRKMMRRGENQPVSVDDLPLADPAPDPEQENERRERVERLAASIARLGDRCRELFRLKLLGMSFGEIREEMNAASINTVYTWDLRCREQLKVLLEGRPN
ncbi:MAG: sigma-70 family RNA polymerase sigma factor [Bryobacteraceae bacterium]|nr:sigma-70 family RNA polymerase sigma factor [Bryobacteraceae bacterium]